MPGVKRHSRRALLGKLAPEMAKKVPPAALPSSGNTPDTVGLLITSKNTPFVVKVPTLTPETGLTTSAKLMSTRHFVLAAKPPEGSGQPT